MFTKDQARVSNCLLNSFHPSPLHKKGDREGSINCSACDNARVEKTKNQNSIKISIKIKKILNLIEFEFKPRMHTPLTPPKFNQ